MSCNLLYADLSAVGTRCGVCEQQATVAIADGELEIIPTVTLERFRQSQDLRAEALAAAAGRADDGSVLLLCNEHAQRLLGAQADVEAVDVSSEDAVTAKLMDAQFKCGIPTFARVGAETSFQAVALSASNTAAPRAGIPTAPRDCTAVMQRDGSFCGAGYYGLKRGDWVAFAYGTQARVCQGVLLGIVWCGRDEDTLNPTATRWLQRNDIGFKPQRCAATHVRIPVAYVRMDTKEFPDHKDILSAATAREDASIARALDKLNVLAVPLAHCTPLMVPPVSVLRAHTAHRITKSRRAEEAEACDRQLRKDTTVCEDLVGPTDAAQWAVGSMGGHVTGMDTVLHASARWRDVQQRVLPACPFGLQPEVLSKLVEQGVVGDAFQRAPAAAVTNTVRWWFSELSMRIPLPPQVSAVDYERDAHAYFAPNMGGHFAREIDQILRDNVDAFRDKFQRPTYTGTRLHALATARCLPAQRLQAGIGAVKACGQSRVSLPGKHIKTREELDVAWEVQLGVTAAAQFGDMSPFVKDRVLEYAALVLSNHMNVYMDEHNSHPGHVSWLSCALALGDASAESAFGGAPMRWKKCMQQLCAGETEPVNDMQCSITAATVVLHGLRRGSLLLQLRRVHDSALDAAGRVVVSPRCGVGCESTDTCSHCMPLKNFWGACNAVVPQEAIDWPTSVSAEGVISALEWKAAAHLALQCAPVLDCGDDRDVLPMWSHWLSRDTLCQLLEAEGDAVQSTALRAALFRASPLLTQPPPATAYLRYMIFLGYQTFIMT